LQPAAQYETEKNIWLKDRTSTRLEVVVASAAAATVVVIIVAFDMIIIQ